ncbi:hypothetical protein HYPSUDRAFT_202430 [Hypholoma sublateritium FD-334 SS-4]|uniref:Uncharacterized protein n=1 Tax=Hypholoma sublateritium (strain FD-334 SS-4) TaxID=945553 RepID=A0A0D2P0H6_HYPSF|nr:hypothetical protein HYPSUDRAFT_202430 [Hypholoma sublateritium FD-334 SS-4]
MAHYTCNPFLAVCPDFASETFARRRQSITSSELSEKQIIEFMKGTWHDANDADRLAWARAAQSTSIDDQDTVKMRLALAAKAEARKTKGNREMVFPIPTTFPLFPSDAAMARLRRGEHVPLWHFTSEGLRSARDNRDANGAEFENVSQSIVPDSKLKHYDFYAAGLRLLQMMELTHWPQKVIDMFHLFFDEIQTHVSRLSMDVLRQKALMRYADERLQMWHMRTKDVIAGNYPLRVLTIDEDLLRELEQTLHQEKRNESHLQSMQMIAAMESECALRFAQHGPPSPLPRRQHKRRRGYVS